jgi:predicted dehydrogenase
MTEQSIGVGIIGTGFGALVQLPGFLGVPGVRVIGIASKDPARSAELAAKHNLPVAFTSAEELIAHPDVQLVSIATPPLQHVSLTKAALLAGKHVLCEKPFTFHGAEAQELLTAAQNIGVVHAIDFEFRELPAMQLLHSKLSSIGTLQSADFRWQVGTWADPTRPWRWQCDKTQGGGVMGALGVHLFDAAEWLCGPMTQLKGILTTKIVERPDENGAKKAVTAEDTIAIEMKTDSAPVTLHLSNVDAAGKGLSITLIGTTGRVTLESLSQDYASGLRVTLNDQVLLEDQPTNSGDARVRPFQAFATRLIQAIQSGTPFEPSFEQGLRSDLLYEAARTSSETGDWVNITQ